MMAPRLCASCGSVPRAPALRTCGAVPCQHAYRAHLLQGKPVCIECSRPLVRPDSDGRRVCSGVNCRTAFLRVRDDGPSCFVCHAPVDSRASVAGTCGFMECASLAPVRRGIDLKKEQADKLLRAVKDLQAGHPESLPLAVFPSGAGKTGSASKRRGQEFRGHLEKLLREAEGPPGDGLSDPPGTSESTPRNDALMGKLCSMCRGFCCGLGGTHAFLTVEDLRLYLERHPEERPAEVMEKYMARLPSRSVGGSCVFHTAKGCALPRDLMSHTCTRFYCEGLARVRREFPDRDLEAVLAVSHRDGRIVKSAVVGPP